MFLTGVDRRVHAPLGTVINFSALLTYKSTSLSQRRVVRFASLVRGGDRLLVILVSSVLSLSGVRSGAVRFRFRGISLGNVLRDVCDTRGVGLQGKIRLLLSLPSQTTIVCASPAHLKRIIGGLVGGTIGFATRKHVAVKCELGSFTALRIFIRSAKANVSRRILTRVFRHFCGKSTFIRNAKLKLTVYEAVIREFRKGVRITSALNGKDHFTVILPRRVQR